MTALEADAERAVKFLAAKAYKDGATLSVEICVLDDEAVGDFEQRIREAIDAARQGEK